MKLSSSLFHTILATAFAVVQSVIFKNGMIAGATPDFALIILILSAGQHGSLKGQTTGFVTGITQDILSVTPLGFHALSRTLIGYLYGVFKGKFFMDPILVPMLLAAIGTILKAVFGFLILSVFAHEYAAVVFTGALGVEIGLNVLTAPFLLGLLKLLSIVTTAREEL
ncbi:MAG: rod shape-determining protein MreD [Spirochaetales bacterium]|nr:rod shape-determining protein MreD [Spirochaetales bacterium]